MIPLETERLVIRNFETSDWGYLHEMIIQYEASEYAAYDQSWPTSPEEIKGVVEWFSSGDNFLAVCLKDRGQFIGFVALNPEQSDENPAYNLGYIFNYNFHGKGYAAEACRAVLSRAFGRLSAERVVSGTAAVNQASCRLLERLGFRKISQSVGSFRTAANGEPVEFLGYQFALTKDEWGRVDKSG